MVISGGKRGDQVSYVGASMQRASERARPWLHLAAVVGAEDQAAARCYHLKTKIAYHFKPIYKLQVASVMWTIPALRSQLLFCFLIIMNYARDVAQSRCSVGFLYRKHCYNYNDSIQHTTLEKGEQK